MFWISDFEFVSGFGFRALPVSGEKVVAHAQPKDRGRFAPIYERIVYHYHSRKGLEMPYSRQVVNKGQSGGRSGGAHVPWGALMFAELPLGVNRIEGRTIPGEP